MLVTTLRRGAIAIGLFPLLAACGASGAATGDGVSRPAAGRAAESPQSAVPAMAARLTPATDTRWLLAPDPASDAVHAGDTEDSLVARYGAANVVRGDVDEGEGMLVNGTILYQGDPIRHLEIKWEDTVARRHPVQVYAVGRGWTIAPGIRLGTTLQGLERMNGGPFELSGFRGHYPGTVGDWRNGRLAWLEEEDAVWGSRATLHMQPGPPFPDGVDYGPYDSEAGFLSSEPGMQRLHPRVTYMAVRPRE